MRDYWQTGKDKSQPVTVVWPSLGQILKQLGTIGLFIVLWSGVFAGYLQLLSNAVEPTPTVAPAVAVEPTIPTNTVAPPPATSTENLSNEATVTPTSAISTSSTVISSTPVLDPTAPPPTETPEPTSTPAPVADTGGVSFANDVFPIIEKRCIKCHGGEETEEGLVMLTYEELMAGSWNGEVIEPGSVEDSLLIELIVEGDMPKKEPRLLPRDVKLISEWVTAGAPNN